MEDTTSAYETEADFTKRGEVEVSFSNGSEMNVSFSNGSELLERYKPEYQILAVTLFSLLFIVGFIGNVMVITVVWKSPKMRTLTNFYLVSLAAADCLVLCGGTLPAIPEFFFYIGQWLYGSAMCSVLVFLQYLGINASALSITAFTIERYVGICHPMKAQALCTVKRAKYVIVGLWVVSILYNAAWLYLAYTEPITDDIQECTFRISRDQYSAIYMVDFVLFYLLPLVLTCVLYSLIAVTLHRSTQKMKKPLNPRVNKPTIMKLMLSDTSISKDFNQSMMGDRRDLLKKMESARLQVSI